MESDPPSSSLDLTEDDTYDVENDGAVPGNKQEQAKRSDRGRIRIKSKVGKVFTMVTQSKLDEELYQKKEQKMSFCGFGGILKISKWTSIRTSFVKCVIDNWEIDRGPQIRLSQNKVLKISEDDVYRVYHLPRGEKRVDISQFTDKAIKRLREELGIKGNFSRTVHYNVLEDKLTNLKNITLWTKTAIIYTIYCLLCPINSTNVDLRYASILEKVNDISKYNWCRHVLEHTTKGISVNNKLNPTADFHFLLINYLERMGTQCRLLIGQFITPSLSGWDESSTIATLIKMEEVMGFSKGVVVGVTKEKRTEDMRVLISFDSETCLMEKNIAFCTSKIAETVAELAPSPVQSKDAPKKFIQSCSLTSSKGDTYCSGKRKAIDDSHSRSSGKGNQVREVVDVIDKPEKAVVEQVISLAEQTPSPLKKLKQSASDHAETPSSDRKNAVQSINVPQNFLEKLKQSISGHAERTPSSDRKNAVQSIDAPQNFLQPCPLTSSICDTLYAQKRKTSDGQTYSPLSIPNNEPIKKNDDSDCRSLSKRNQVTKVVDAINEPEKVIYEQGDYESKPPVSSSEPASTECSKSCPITSCFSLRSDNSQSWPFTKKSSMWKVIESMEVFQKVPQMPHFSPLTEHEEKSREMLAINMMMKYSYEVESIGAGSLDDLSSIQGTLKTLKELEFNGFNTNTLQVHLNKLLVKMGEEEELKEKLEEVESGIRKCQDENTEIERKVNDLDEQIKALQQQFRAEKKVKCLKDLQLSNLEAQRDIMTRKLHDFQLARKLPFEW